MTSFIMHHDYNSSYTPDDSMKPKPETLDDYIALFQAVKDKLGHGNMKIKQTSTNEVGNVDEYGDFEDIIIHEHAIQSLVNDSTCYNSESEQYLLFVTSY